MMACGLTAAMVHAVSCGLLWGSSTLGRLTVGAFCRGDNPGQ